MALSLCTISGQFSNPDGSPVANGLLRLTLSQVGVVTGTTQVVPSVVSFTLNSSGQLSGLIIGNDQVSPGGTVYYAKLYAVSGEFLADWQGLGFYINNSTFNFNNAAPVSGSNLIYPVVGPTGATGATGLNGAPGTTNVAWADIQAYGSSPKPFAFNSYSAGATTVAASPNVAIASGTMAGLIKNGQGVTIYKAGAATGLTSAPTAPTVTSPAVTGPQTLTYKATAYDALGGLSPASLAATVSAPAVFGALPQVISSCSVTSNVLTLNFANPLNTTVTAGMTIHVVGIPLVAGANWNGVRVIASAPTTSSVTIALTTANGTGAPTSTSTGRVSNSAIITAISRAANGVVTVTLSHAPAWATQAGLNPTLVCIENCAPADLNYYGPIASISGTTLTYNTGILSAETGTLGAGGLTSTATVWEYTTVACPALSGTTVGYYIYSDSAAPGGALALIGRCIAGECHFTDWGPTIMAGYAAPAYVPTTPPSSAQNQMFTSTVLSGGGTTSLVLTTNVTSSVPSLGATIVFDDGPNLVAAMNAAAGNTGIAGSVLLSAPTTATQFPGYFFNSPITIPSNISLIIACPLYVNETITVSFETTIDAQFGSVLATGPASSYGRRNYAPVSGIANPVFLVVGQGGQAADNIDGLLFSNLSNGTAAVQIQSCQFTEISNCAFQAATTFGNAWGIIYNGGCTSVLLENISYNYSNRFFGNGVLGQSGVGPPIPTIWFRCSDNPALPNNGVPTDQVVMRGANTGLGRGIMFDHINATETVTQAIYIGDTTWIQQGTTPCVMLWGQNFFNVFVNTFVTDTSQQAILANWSTTPALVINITVKNGTTSLGAPTITGGPIAGLTQSGNQSQDQTQTWGSMSGVALTTTNGTTDSVSIPGATANSPVALVATNAAAATMLYTAPGIYVSSQSAGTAVLTHGASLAGATFWVSAQIN